MGRFMPNQDHLPSQMVAAAATCADKDVVEIFSSSLFQVGY